jgi:hypothetical protein
MVKHEDKVKILPYWVVVIMKIYEEEMLTDLVIDSNRQLSLMVLQFGASEHFTNGWCV